MSLEYQPEYDLQQSRQSLAEDTRGTEATSEALFKRNLDVLASRGGQRWANIKEIGLVLPKRYKDNVVFIGYQPRTEEDDAYIFMRTADDKSSKTYHVVAEEHLDDPSQTLYDLYAVDDRQTPGNQREHLASDGLAPARLLDILSAGHHHTPRGRFPEVIINK